MHGAAGSLASIDAMDLSILNDPISMGLLGASVLGVLALIARMARGESEPVNHSELIRRMRRLP